MWTSTIKKYKIYILISLIVIFFSYFIYLNSLKKVDYSKLQHTNSLGLLLVKQESLLKKQDITVYRLEDSTPQTVPGIWRHTFTLPHEVFFYGFPETQPDNQAVIALNDKDARTKNVSGLPGIVLNIQPSPSSDYLMISGQKNNDGDLYTCIISRKKTTYGACKMIVGDILSPKEFNKVTPHISFWDPSEQSTLIILENGPARRAFTYISTSSHLLEITDDGEKDHLQEKLSQSISITTNYSEKFSHYGPFTITRDALTNKTRFFIALGDNKFFKLSDTFTLLINKNEIWVVNMVKKEKSLLTSFDENFLPEFDYYFNKYSSLAQ